MPAGGAADDGLVTALRTFRDPHARGRLFAALLGVALAALLLAPGGARALVVNVKVGAGTTTVGEQPTSEALLWGQAMNKGEASEKGNPNAGSFNNPLGHPVIEGEPKFGANPETNAVNAYVIFWEDGHKSWQGQYQLYSGEWQALIDGYMGDLSGASETGGNDVFRVDSQYTDVTGAGLTGHATGRTRFLGAYTDTEPYPSKECVDPLLIKLSKEEEKEFGEPWEAGCLTDAQIRAQLHDFIEQHGLKAGINTIFFVLTPPRVGVCVDEGENASHCSQDNGGTPAAAGLCSYHSYFEEPGGGDVLYAAIPWTYGDLGGEGVEAANTGITCQDGGWNENAEKGGPLKKTKVPQEANQLSTFGPDGLWDEGVAELAIGQIASEEQNTITDPLLNGWQDRETLKSGEEVGYENTDECRDDFLAISGGGWTAKEHTGAGTLSNQMLSGAPFYINDAFNLAAHKLSYPGVPCMPGVNVAPDFTIPPTVNAGEVVGFDGMESNITLNGGEKFNAKGEEEPAYAKYTWNFGDGSPEVTGYAPGSPPGNPPAYLCEAPWVAPCAASTFHAYQYGGVYQVTLTIEDVGGNVGTATRTINVVGPPPPGTPAGAPGTPTGATAGGTGGGAGAGTGGSGTPLPAPEAKAAATSTSLKQVARSGLVVHYSVNEQVAGRFEVLLETATAHRLGISGPAATGLPAGYPQSLVIGHALLVAVKGGHSSVRIKFSKSIARHLRRAHRVTLTLRLVVHNAATQNPLFSTSISTAVLHG
jgi:hypothetical protein